MNFNTPSLTFAFPWSLITIFFVKQNMSRLMNTDPSNHPPEDSSAIPQAATWLCYILRCSDGALYTGVTNDMDKRLAAHNAGTAAKYTRTRRPVEIAMVECCANKSAALKREAAIKALSRAEKLKLVEVNQKCRTTAG